MKSISFSYLITWLTLSTTIFGYSFEAFKTLHGKRGGKTKDDFLVTKLPGLYDLAADDIPLMFSGQLELYKENDTHLFFWKYVDNNIDPEYKKRTIFWLNGGPGCSSMDGALMEAGPFRISSQGKVVKNSGSWHEAGDMVFVDQPAGTGFSYTKEYDHDLDQIVWQFLKFLEKFYTLFPEDRDNEIFFAGESYAGQYIPYIANGILQYNKNLKPGEQPYNLKGLLIGNGWIAPDIQSLSYLPYSVAAGIIDNKNPHWNDIIKQHEKCQNVVNSVPKDSMADLQVVSETCEIILNKLLSATLDNSASSDQVCYNMYDYTLKDSYPSCGMNWPPDLSVVEPFLNSKEVQNNLNLQLFKKWHECSGKVSRFFKAEHSVPAVQLLPDILNEVPIVLFNGNRDIICNYIGTEDFIKQLKWNGATGFTDDETFDWIYSNEVSGYIKTERNLTFVNVFDASHMVPFDKPEVSRSLIDLLVNNYDIEELKDVGGNIKRAIKTYPLGVRKQKPSQEEGTSSVASSVVPEPSSAVPESASIASSMPTESTVGGGSESDTDSDSDSDAETGNDNETSSRITRVIQLIVLIIIIWGVYMLYSHYRSRPSSIIKTKPSGRKKNVQWADQLRQFQDIGDNDADDSHINGEPSFIVKVLNKFRGIDNGYSATNNDFIEDIELGDNLPVDEFIIDSDDEQHVYKQQSSESLPPSTPQPASENGPGNGDDRPNDGT